jgi:hypothetical protein
MDWKRGNQLSSYLRSSLWIVPIGAVILEQTFSLPVRMLDARLGWSRTRKVWVDRPMELQLRRRLEFGRLGGSSRC